MLDARPAGGGQHDNCDFATHEVLLISEILVSRDQNGKAVLFGLLQQFTVFQIVPAQLEGRGDLMGGEVFAKRDRSTLVEKNAHSSRFERAGGVLKYGADLLKRDAREPGDEVRDLSPVFEVLEQGRDGNAGAAKHPGATHALGVTFHGWTCRPINHELIVDLALR